MKTSPRKRLSVLAIGGVVMIAMSLVAASPANAGTAEALTRCRAGVGGNFNTNVVVNQSPATFGFRSEVWPGDVLRVTATGGIKIDSWPWTSYLSPDGRNEPAPSGGYWPASGLRKFSLVGNFNDTGQKVQLGRDSGCVVYNGPVKTFLWLQINDDYVLDNSGQWNAVIRQFW